MTNCSWVHCKTLESNFSIIFRLHLLLTAHHLLISRHLTAKLTALCWDLGCFGTVLGPPWAIWGPHWPTWAHFGLNWSNLNKKDNFNPEIRYFVRFLIYSLSLFKRVPFLNRTAFNIIIIKQTTVLFKFIKILTVHSFLSSCLCRNVPLLTGTPLKPTHPWHPNHGTTSFQSVSYNNYTPSMGHNNIWCIDQVTHMVMACPAILVCSKLKPGMAKKRGGGGGWTPAKIFWWIRHSVQR